MQVYGDIQSGNCYKIKLLLSLLNLPHEWIHVDILSGQTRQTRFLAMNPIGKIPLLVLDDGRFLAESNAILNFLGNGSALVPQDTYDHAKMLQWQFFEQYSHEPYIAVARFIAKFLGMPENRRSDYEAKHSGGHQALAVMEVQLQQTAFLVSDQPSLADISLYGYTHVAHEGGFSLHDYPGIRQWLVRIEDQPGYIAMD